MEIFRKHVLSTCDVMMLYDFRTSPYSDSGSWGYYLAANVSRILKKRQIKNRPNFCRVSGF